MPVTNYSTSDSRHQLFASEQRKRPPYLLPDEPWAGGQWKDHDDFRTTEWMHRAGIKAGVDIVGKAVQAVGRAATEQQDEHFQDDAWTPLVLDWLEKSTQVEFTVGDILDGALGIPIEKWTPGDQTRVDKILTKHGYKKGKRTNKARPYINHTIKATETEGASETKGGDGYFSKLAGFQ